MSVIHEWEGKLSEVMERAVEKIKVLGDERMHMIGQHKQLKDQLKEQEEANNVAKNTIKKLMDEITAQLKLKYELEHDISRVHSRKILEEKDLSRISKETENVESGNAGEILKAKQKALAEHKRRESVLEKKREELAKEYIENDKLRVQLKEYKNEILALKEELNMATEKEKSLDKKSRHCTTTLDNLFKYFYRKYKM